MHKRQLRGCILLLVLLVLAVPLGAVAQAQDSGFTVRVIPLNSIGYEFALSPDGRTLATYENMLLNGSYFVPELLPLRLFDVQTGEELGALAGANDHAVSAAFSPDGAQLVTFHQNGELNLWDVSSMRLVRTLVTFVPGGGRVRYLPDGMFVLAQLIGSVTQFALVEIDTGHIVRLYGPRIETYAQFQEINEDTFARFSLFYAAFATSPDGTQFAAANANGALDLWTLADGSVQRLKEEAEDKGRLNIRSMTFTADGTTLVYFDALDTQMHFMDVKTGVDIRVVPGALNFALSPDEQQIAWIDRREGVLHLAPLPAAAGSRVLLNEQEAAGFAGLPGTLAFTADGAHLVLGGFYVPDGENAIFIVDLP